MQSGTICEAVPQGDNISFRTTSSTNVNRDSSDSAVFALAKIDRDRPLNQQRPMSYVLLN